MTGEQLQLLGIACSGAVAATAAYSFGLCFVPGSNRRVHALSTITAAASAVYGLAASLQMTMGPTAGNLLADRVQFGAMLVLAPSMLALAQALRGIRQSRAWVWLTAVSAVLFVLVVATPWVVSAQFEERQLALLGRAYDAISGPLTPLLVAHVLLCAVWATWGYIRYAARQRQRRIAWLVYSGAIVCLVTGVNDALVKLRLIDTPFLFVFGAGGCAATVATISLFTHLEALREADRSRESLEAAVEARTRELRDAQDRLMQEHQLAALGRLSAGVAHEINNPLAAIQANLSFLREAVPPETLTGQIESALDESFEACHRMSQIIKDLSSLSRRRRGGLIRMRLASPVQASLRFLSRSNPRARNVTAELDEEAWVEGDETGLGQVALNLIENAPQSIEDRPEGEGKILVAVDAKDGAARLTVEDNGRGVPRELRSRIFEPFFTTKGVGRGTGLGLSICARIVAEHGGAIEVEDPAGGGARFVVTLPSIRDGAVT